MDNLLEIHILGTFSVRRGDGTTVAPVAWRTSKTRSLVRMLALHAGAPVPADRVVEALWPDVGSAKGRGSLRMAVSQIRKVIGKDCVVRQFDGLVLQHAWVDAVAFSSLTAEARRLFAQGQPAEGVATAREATALYGGDLCADEPYAEWAFADREALRALRATVLAEAAEAAVGLNRHRLAIDMAEQLVAGDPAHERAYRVLMRAHARLGETDRALGAYERCRTTLVEAFGADPSHETRVLHAELLSTGSTDDMGQIVSRKLVAVAEPRAHGEALGRSRQPLTEPSDDPVERVRTMSAIGSMLALRSPVAATDVLRTAVGMADEMGDVAAQVEARVVLATHAHAPMRRFAECEQGVRDALALADAGDDDAVLAQGLLASKQATVALGSAWQTVATLTRADELADRAGESRLASDAQLLLALTAHELGASDFAERWAASWEQASRVPSAGIWRWVPARVLYERGYLAHAGEVLAPSLRGGHGALDHQMVRLCAARLAAERGTVDEAIELLTAAADLAVDTGVTVVLPELAARLAVLEAHRDPVAAAARLDQAETALGESVFAREQTAIMLGRAALLAAHGQPQAAADMAGAAGVASRGAGLVFGHAEALTAQAGYLTTAGDHPRALAALRRAGEQYSHADAPARLRATSDLAARLGLDWEIGVGAR